MKIAFVFPGQGSQSQGMLTDLYDQYKSVRDTFDNASKCLGFDLYDIIKNDIDKLNLTENCQPAILTSSYAIFQLIKELYPNIKPEFFAGHSLGEYSALLCSECFSFNDAINLVRLRGKKMQESFKGNGAMYAILGLEDHEVIKACKESEQNQIVNAVNFNSPGQVVIAGEKDAVERAAILCKQKGAKRVLPLSVSIPSHCSLMRPAAEYIKTYLDTLDIKVPNNIKVLHNYDLSSSETSTQIKEALIYQLYKPVLWTQLVNKLVDNGVTKLIEIGPGKVLSGLAPRINSNLTAISVNNIDSLEKLNDFIK